MNAPETPTRAEPRVAVIIPCFNDGELVREAVGSVREEEPVEVAIVDDGSSDPLTLRVLDELEAAGATVVHQQNAGVPAARTAGLRASSAPYVFPLDADDQAVPGTLAKMADLLDSRPDVAVTFGDYEEFGAHEAVRVVPDWLDPYRVAFANEYAISALFRREALERIGGWEVAGRDIRGYEDWHVWMALAENGEKGVHVGAGSLGYRRRIHGSRLLSQARRRHRELYRSLRELHPRLFAELREHRRRSDLSRPRKLLYPLVYGRRPRFGWEREIKVWADRLGLNFWELRRR
jgi:glycosyltransferase involved in cell wall biosynthesis